MNNTGRLGIVAALVSTLALGTAYAQSSENQRNQKDQQSQQNQQSQQTQQSQQSQNQDDQSTGVSHPPPDSTIQATEMPPNPAPPSKPSPAIPATSANASAPAGAQGVAAPANPPRTGRGAQGAGSAQAANPDDGIVTSVPAANAGDTGNDNDDNNPDYGIVTSAPPANAGATTPDGWNADNAIVNSVPVDPNALAEGTNITVQLKQDLSTNSTEAGSTFIADVTQNVYNGSQLVIPAGSEMRGRVVHVSHGHHLINRATIMLRPDMIVLPDGTAYHLYATAVESFAPGTDVNDEGGIVASHHYVKDAVEYGAGAGAGAAAGGAIGGPVGAGTGAVVGTGLVGTHMLMQPPQSADLPKGSMLIFSLTEPMPLTPTTN
jgi:type IV secretory pathway VirB10-like protein